MATTSRLPAVLPVSAAIPPTIIATVYVRHQPKCPFRQGPYSRKCRCPKYLNWSLNGTQERKSAKTRTWTIAEQKARDKEDERRYRGDEQGVLSLYEQSRPLGEGSFEEWRSQNLKRARAIVEIPYLTKAIEKVAQDLLRLEVLEARRIQEILTESRGTRSYKSLQPKAA